MADESVGSPEPVGQVSEPVSMIDELIGDSPASEPSGADGSGDAEPASTSEGEPSAELAEPETETEPQAAAQAQPQVTQSATGGKFKFKGKEYTHEELLRDPRAVNALIQTYEQFPHLQSKYTQALETVRAIQEQQIRQAPQQGRSDVQQQAGPQVTPAQLQAQMRAMYHDKAKQAAAEGFLEKDFVEDYPDLASHIMRGLERISRGEAVIAQMMQQTAGERMSREQADYSGAFTRALDAVAERGDMYANLKDPAARDGFFNYMQQLNPSAAQAIDPEFLSAQWIAFNRDVIVQAQQARNQQLSATRKSQRVAARGEGTAVRPAGAGATKTTLPGSITDLLGL
jgi:hypothetical protein